MVDGLPSVDISRAWQAQPDEGRDPLGRLVWRPAIHRRNDVAWIGARAWRSGSKEADLAALKRAKAALDASLLAIAARELAILAGQFIGAPAAVTCVACGHSRRPDCFGKRLAQAVAAHLRAPFVQAFADRFCAGSSHPKEFRKLPPLERVATLPSPALLVDDVATSGWHVEEALLQLRGHAAAAALVWISGNVVDD